MENANAIPKRTRIACGLKSNFRVLGNFSLSGLVFNAIAEIM